MSMCCVCVHARVQVGAFLVIALVLKMLSHNPYSSTALFPPIGVSQGSQQSVSQAGALYVTLSVLQFDNLCHVIGPLASSIIHMYNVGLHVDLLGMRTLIVTICVQRYSKGHFIILI